MVIVVSIMAWAARTASRVPAPGRDPVPESPPAVHARTVRQVSRLGVVATPVSTIDAGGDVPDEVRAGLSGLALAAAGANVVMQLAQLPVGHGVAKSRVDSGRIDRHPIKRTRTTLAYLVIALYGTEEERAAMRREVNRQHRHVRSEPGDPVAYDAFDAQLQLWVAACLYVGVEDVHTALHGPPDERTAEVLYAHSSRLATTLQVGEDQWPEDRAAFQRYWDEQVARIDMDDVTRPYLQGIAGAEFVGWPLHVLLGPLSRLLTMGFLPPAFRDELRLRWDRRHQAVFDALMRTAAALNGVLPRSVREFPLNVYLWDTRRRIRNGRAIV